MWPYLQSLRSSKELYGWCVSAFSIAQICISPIIGFMSDHLPAKPIFIVFIVLKIICWIIYSLAQDSFMVLMSRILLGVASDANPLFSVYVARTTPLTKRTLFISLLALAQIVGFVVGPSIGAVLSLVPTLDISRYPKMVIKLNECTCIFVVFLNILFFYK